MSLPDLPDPPAALPDPILTADSLLRQCGQVTPPVDLQRILALWPNLQVTLEQIDAPGYLIDLNAAGGEILLRRQDTLARRRFTLAHEIGHWTIRFGCVMESSSWYSSIATSSGAGNRSPDVERWCDAFAANLLVPSRWVQSLDRVQLAELPERLWSMPNEYRVSRTAAWRQVADVTSLNIIVIGRGRTRAEYQSLTSSPRFKILFRRWAEQCRPTRDVQLDTQGSYVTAMQTVTADPDLSICVARPRESATLRAKSGA